MACGDVVWATGILDGAPAGHSSATPNRSAMKVESERGMAPRPDIASGVTPAPSLILPRERRMRMGEGTRLHPALQAAYLREGRPLPAGHQGKLQIG